MASLYNIGYWVPNFKPLAEKRAAEPHLSWPRHSDMGRDMPRDIHDDLRTRLQEWKVDRRWISKHYVSVGEVDVPEVDVPEMPEDLGEG